MGPIRFCLFGDSLVSYRRALDVQETLRESVKQVRSDRGPAERLAHGSGCDGDMLQGAVPSTVICLQHSHVFTLGKRGSLDDIRMSTAEVRLCQACHSMSKRPTRLAAPCLGMQIERSGAEVHAVKRGGEVTYHGPGQCVIYPIMDVRKIGARAFVEALENSIIATLGAWGIHSYSADGSTAGVRSLLYTATALCSCDFQPLTDVISSR